MPNITAVDWPDGGRDLSGTGATMRHVAVKAGHVATRHDHDFEQFLFVASGAGRLQCEQGTIPLRAGTALHLPRSAWHSAEFTADTVLIEVNLAG